MGMKIWPLEKFKRMLDTLLDFEAGEQEAAAAGEAAVAAASSAAAAAACSPSIEGGPESWGGEGYEEDAVLAPGGGKKAGVGAAYLKFSRQLARCPDQCARYR